MSVECPATRRGARMLLTTKDRQRIGAAQALRGARQAVARVEVLQLRDGSAEIHHEHRMATRFTASAVARLIRKMRGLRNRSPNRPRLLT